MPGPKCQRTSLKPFSQTCEFRSSVFHIYISTASEGSESRITRNEPLVLHYLPCTFYFVQSFACERKCWLCSSCSALSLIPSMTSGSKGRMFTRVIFIVVCGQSDLRLHYMHANSTRIEFEINHPAPDRNCMYIRKKINKPETMSRSTWISRNRGQGDR